MVSIIIPTYNRHALLQQCLASVFAQTEKDFEVVVVNDGSSDGTAAYLDSLENVRVLSLAHGGAAQARNAGAAIARGEILVFIDDDCVAESLWLGELVRPLRETSAYAVFGAVLYKNFGHAAYNECVIHNPNACWSMAGNFAIRRRIFERLGGFDTELCGSEDKDLALRIWQIGEVARAPQAHVIHAPFFWTAEELSARVSRAAGWVKIKKNYDLRIDKNHAGPFVGFFYDPRDFGAIIKYAALAPFNVLQWCILQDERGLFWLRWLTYLVRRRIVVWRTALRERVLVV